VGDLADFGLDPEQVGLDRGRAPLTRPSRGDMLAKLARSSLMRQAPIPSLRSGAPLTTGIPPG
jgi:hypothetical protein